MSLLSLPRPILGSLSLGIARLSIRAIHTDGTTPLRPEASTQTKAFGERIFIFDNVWTKQVVHSLTPVINVYKAQKQMPFSGKNSKPKKIRKDLWRQLCVVEFPAGRADVGHSVFARLREFRRRHELEWPDDVLYEPNKDKDTKRMLTRNERGKKIQEQRENAIADLAAVLAGAGRGNRIFKVRTEPERMGEGEGETKGESEGEVAEANEARGEETDAALVQATVLWANNLDKNYAMEWSPNVTHGMLPGGRVWELVDEKPPAKLAT